MTEGIAEWRRDAHAGGAGLFGVARQSILRFDDEFGFNRIEPVTRMTE